MKNHGKCPNKSNCLVFKAMFLKEIPQDFSIVSMSFGMTCGKVDDECTA